jgi:hypothetical protein
MLPYGIIISSHLNDSNLNENMLNFKVGALAADNNINNISNDKNDLFFMTSKI